MPRVATSRALETVAQLAAEIAEGSQRQAPFVVALDGRSASGKSTVAGVLAAELDVAMVDCDDFYAGGSLAEWQARSPAEKADWCIDWRRLRAEAVEPLLAGRTATWRPFDWDAGHGLADHWTARKPGPVLVLDGAYSARPELADLVDLAVLVALEDDGERRRRLRARDGNDDVAAWQAVWDEAEDHYFRSVRPEASFPRVLRR